MNNYHTSITSKMQADYDAIAGAFDESRYGMHWPELDRLLDEVKPGSWVLDIGCGTGRICSDLSGRDVKYTGVEISEQQLEKAKAHCTTGTFQQADMLDLPFDDQSFDEVLMVASLHHLLTKEDRIKALSEAVRVLRTEGRLIITVKAFWQWRYFKLFVDKKAGKKTISDDLRKHLKWSDVFMPWKWRVDKPVYRYYHAFYKRELQKLVQQLPVKIEQINYFKNGQKASFYTGKNIVVVVLK